MIVVDIADNLEQRIYRDEVPKDWLVIQRLARHYQRQPSVIRVVLRLLAERGVVEQRCYGGKTRYLVAGVVSFSRYQHIADDLEERIARGEFTDGWLRINPLAKGYGCDPQTLLKSLRLLAERGVTEELPHCGPKPHWRVCGVPTYSSKSKAVLDDMRARIMRGQWKRKTLPARPELAEMYGVAVRTIGTVLAALYKEFPEFRKNVSYREIADVLERRILTGAWATGMLVPLKEVAREFRTKPDTARRAMEVLQVRGLAESNAEFATWGPYWTVHHPDSLSGQVRPDPEAIAADIEARWSSETTLPSMLYFMRRYHADSYTIDAALKLVRAWKNTAGLAGDSPGPS
ncbi:GntR family transcriptional regulator [Saccharopolyspora sp. K220]|uniref:GntR family transcriptional regulator n=1 Tax=Saccharopolyspora soli TaxID=2926618 RepID=UPI001F5962FA|nr:GntR family transcriptional regulator [Saccharopolyspora soli]MCI2424360.1 GntR family transcriptional regulator [Saccharopolyspora soli]